MGVFTKERKDSLVQYIDSIDPKIAGTFENYIKTLETGASKRFEKTLRKFIDALDESHRLQYLRAAALYNPKDPEQSVLPSLTGKTITSNIELAQFLNKLNTNAEREYLYTVYSYLDRDEFLLTLKNDFRYPQTGYSDFRMLLRPGVYSRTPEVTILTSHLVLSNETLPAFLNALVPSKINVYLQGLATAAPVGLLRRAVLSNEKLPAFLNEISDEAAHDYFYAIREAPEDRLGYYLNDKVLSNAKFFKKMNVSNRNNETASLEAVVEMLNSGLAEIEPRDSRVVTYANIYVDTDRRITRPTPSNIKIYEDIINNYLSSTYGFEKHLDFWNIRTLFEWFNIYKLDHEGQRRGMANLVNKSERRFLKSYSLRATAPQHDYSVFELVSSAVASIIRKSNGDNAERKLAVMIAGEKNVNSANNTFLTHKEIRTQVFEAIRRGVGIDTIYRMLYDYATKHNDERMLHVLSIVDESERTHEPHADSSTLYAFESNNPLDFNNKKQSACVFLPNGSSKWRGILEYVRHEEVHLLDFTIGKMPAAAAITFVSGKNLVVDSVEGGLKVHGNRQILGYIDSYIMDFARMLGMERVLYNTNVYNPTSLAFLDMIKEKGATGPFRTEDVVFPRGVGYLESLDFYRFLVIRLPRNDSLSTNK